MLNIFGSQDLESFISDLSITVTVVGSVLIVLLLLVAVIVDRQKGKKPKRLKLPLFVAICVVVLGTTFTIGGGTVYLNVNSATGGPVHWHADFEIWACGNELELRDPHGFLSNKVGTPTYHEHNDKRIHVEGVPINLPYDFSLGKFMTVVSGGMTQTSLIVPLNDDKYFENGEGETDGDGNGAPAPELVTPLIETGADGKVANLINGRTCGDQPAEVQVFAMHFNDGNQTYKQTKVTDIVNYMPAKEPTVPAGDCIIIEFAPPKDRTDKLCKQYGVRDRDRCAAFGVPPARDHNICDVREVR
ncbi:MAG TPA: hypothetical protein VM581_03190 [Magnetospirillaceae bacterium]|nr:hypothetical protein [Magnetospirillaceae bacterium]